MKKIKCLIFFNCTERLNYAIKCSILYLIPLYDTMYGHDRTFIFAFAKEFALATKKKRKQNFNQSAIVGILKV